MSDEQQHPFQDPMQMRVGVPYQAATQLVVGLLPQCDFSATAPGNTAFHTHAGGQAASS